MTSVKMTSTGIILAFAFSTVFIVARCNTAGRGPGKDTQPQKDRPKGFAGNGFAVLELFTSEGCSSCPPADEVLARVQEEAGDKPVYVLAYHVDYWDHLGWKDKFSNPMFSQRQQRYHEQFTSQVYTPQLVINGRLELVGSDASAVSHAVERSLGDGAIGVLELKGQQRSGEVDLQYQISGDLIGGQLVIAIVQKHAVSKVARGENAGLTLSHAQIVRNLYQFDPVNNKGSVKIDVPDGFNAQDWEVIGMMQDPASGVIKAAKRLSLQRKDNL